MARVHVGQSGTIFGAATLSRDVHVTCSDGREATTVVRIWTEGGSVSVHDIDQRAITMAPRVAALYGIQLSESEVSDAVIECRVAIAEHALAELRKAERARAEVAS